MVEQSLMMIRSLMVLGDMGRAFSSIYEKHLDKDNAFFASVFTVSSEHTIFQKK
jgi:hypothetical protein